MLKYNPLMLFLKMTAKKTNICLTTFKYQKKSRDVTINFIRLGINIILQIVLVIEYEIKVWGKYLENITKNRNVSVMQNCKNSTNYLNTCQTE